MNVAKAVHNRLYSAYSLKEVFTTYAALRAPSENSSWRSVSHDNVSIARDRVFGNASDFVCGLMRFIESVLVVVVGERPVAKSWSVGRDIDRESCSVLQKERVRAFVQKRYTCFCGKRSCHDFDSLFVIFGIFWNTIIITLRLLVCLIQLQVVVTTDYKFQLCINHAQHFQCFLE